jgi:hypothetical protein
MVIDAQHWLKGSACFNRFDDHLRLFTRACASATSIANAIGNNIRGERRAETKAWKWRTGSIGHQAWVHGNELVLRAAQR